MDGGVSVARNRLMESAMPPENPLMAGATPADAWDFNAAAYREWAARKQAEGVAAGLNDPATGWPTQAGIVDSAQQFGNALLMGSVAPRGIPARIAKYAEGMGYNVAKDASKLSGSEYLNLTHDKMPDGSLKIRISDHNLPPPYGVPGDIDVHTKTPREQSIGWPETVRYLAERAGVPVPAPVAAVLAKAEAKAQAAAAAERATMIQSPAYQEGVLAQTYPDQWRAVGAMAGAERSSARRALAAQYETANPGQLQWAPYLAPK